MLVSGKEMLQAAMEGGYAVGAFNVNNLEILQAVLEAAEEERAPVIIAATEGALDYAGPGLLSAMVREAAHKTAVPLCFHLDHGKSMEAILLALRHGFTSIMLDASHLPFEENLMRTREAVGICHPLGVSVEAELGRLKGMEDGISVEERDAFLVNPDEAERFAKETGIDSLAPAVGTSHGAFKFKGEPRLDFERLALVKKRTGLPLVLHGASSVLPELYERVNRFGGSVKGAKGVPPDQIKKAISLGVCKVNVDTDLRLAFTGALRQALAENPGEFDPRKLLGPAKKAMKEVVREKIRMLGCAGKG